MGVWSVIPSPGDAYVVPKFVGAPRAGARRDLRSHRAHGRVEHTDSIEGAGWSEGCNRVLERRSVFGAPLVGEMVAIGIHEEKDFDGSLVEQGEVGVVCTGFLPLTVPFDE